MNRRSFFKIIPAAALLPMGLGASTKLTPPTPKLDLAYFFKIKGMIQDEYFKLYNMGIKPTTLLMDRNLYNTLCRESNNVFHAFGQCPVRVRDYKGPDGFLWLVT